MAIFMQIFRTLFVKRDFIYTAIKGEIRGQYARSRFGYTWIILHPLSQTLMFALVLSKIMAAKLPGLDGAYGYAMYLLSGLLAWSLFVEIVSRSTNMFVEYSSVMKKISFPRIAIPFIITGHALVNNFFLLLAVFFVFLLFGFLPLLSYFWLPVVVLVNVVLAMGIGLTLGVLNVFLRDVTEIMKVILQFWFWLTPIVYPVAIIPENVSAIIKFNPMFYVVSWYQEILVFDSFVFNSTILVIVLIAMLLIGFSMFLYRRASSELVDVL